MIRRRNRPTRGQALVETAIVAPVLLLILLGLIELGNGLSIKHKVTVLSREGANIASRGTTLTQTVGAVMGAGDEIDLATRGGVVVSRIMVIGGEPVIEAQQAHPGYEGASRLGVADSVATALAGLQLLEGQALYAVEIVYDYQALTPVAGLLPDVWTDQVYERAIF